MREHFSTCKRAEYSFRTALHSPDFVERTMNSFDINERENERQRAIESCGESKSSMIRSTDKSKLHIIVLETELIYIELKMVLSRLYQFWPTVETRQLPSLRPNCG